MIKQNDNFLFVSATFALVLIVTVTAVIASKGTMYSSANMGGQAYYQIGMSCGDGYCSPIENRYGNCAIDCSSPSDTCGNGICEDGEATMCPICQGDVCPERPCILGTCDRDCRLSDRKPKDTCGNGICEDGEATMCPICKDDICPDQACVLGTCDQDCLAEYR